MKKIICVLKRKFMFCVWGIQIIFGYLLNALTLKKEDMAFFNPSLDTENLGDNIIAYYCKEALKNYFDSDTTYEVPTHYLMDSRVYCKLLKYKRKIVFGTNLITPNFEKFSIWTIPRSCVGFHNTITLGVGSGSSGEEVSKFSKLVYRSIFSSMGIHSVRDSSTEKLFHKMGIHNVVNTGCPTLWKLTPEHCKDIPKHKANKVIATVTDYDRDLVQDKKMLSILKDEYEEVYIWLQGIDDQEYLEILGVCNDVKIIERDLEKYTQMLNEGEIDYIGTRLHAGIHALNHKVRSLIISIDNRAEEMNKDFLLPVLKRSQIDKDLRTWIYGQQETKLKLPWEQIEKWKNQFDNRIKQYCFLTE